MRLLAPTDKLRRLNLRLRDSRFIFALQESFVALAPFVILASALMLVAQIPIYFDWGEYLNVIPMIALLARVLQLFTSIAVVISIAYHFALRYDVDRIQTVLLALAVFLSTRSFVTKSFNVKSTLLSLPFAIDVWQIGIPITAVFLFRALAPRLKLSLNCKTSPSRACMVLRYQLVFFVSYAVLLPSWWLLWQAGGLLEEETRYLAANIPNGLMMVGRLLTTQAFWFVGVHGNRMARSFFGASLNRLHILPNLPYQQFTRLFAVAGGSGMGLSLLIALYLARDEEHLKIARVSTPFVLFNIDTILIYCLPIVFNRFLLIPFVFLPLINLAIAYAFLSVVPVTFQLGTIHWATPPLIDAWIAGGGNPWLIALQAFLILLGALVYYPFVKQFAAAYSLSHHQENLTRNLELPESLQVHHGLHFHAIEHEIIEATLRLEETLGLLTSETLRLYYQPLISVQKQRCVGAEALLRLRLPDDTIAGPFFLHDIENGGLAPVLDIWVCRQVKAHLQTWKAEHFTPLVNINLHPDTLNNPKALDKIIHLMEGEQVEFEIVERAFLEDENTMRNLEKLKKHHFRIAIDDFGQGYSSYHFLSHVDVDTVKIDQSLVGMLHRPKGQLIWEHMISLTRRLGIQMVAEGVETEEQARILTKMGVDIIQGFFFARAMPMAQIHAFCSQPLSLVFSDDR